MSYISRWLLLVSVILQISNLEAILYSEYFFIHPVYYLLSTVNLQFCWLEVYNLKNSESLLNQVPLLTNIYIHTLIIN